MTKIRVSGEGKEGKFKRIAEARVNKLLKQLRVLRNCANTQVYAYTDSQVNKIFRVLDEEVKITKSAFHSQNKTKRRINL